MITGKETCDTQTALISVLCVALIIMTSQSIILGFIYRRWKRPNTGTNQPPNRRSTTVHRNRSDRSNTSNNRIQNGPAEPRPSPPEPPQTIEQPTVEYAVPNRGPANDNATNDSADAIYMNQPHVSPPGPPVIITKKKKNVPPQTLAVSNELYADMEVIQQENARRGMSPGGQSVSGNLTAENETYFNTGASYGKAPNVPAKPKK